MALPNQIVKSVGGEGICEVKGDEKEGLCTKWRNTSSAAVRRREAILEAERREAEGDGREERMMKRTVKRANASTILPKYQNPSTPDQDSKAPQEEEVDVNGNNKEEGGEGEGKGEDVEESKGAPEKVKLSFGLKGKAVSKCTKAPGVMKERSVFKRPHAEECQDGKGRR
ncbi:hypothetical protein K469DRAFT_807857 [Zopfia rhizophila CBS 207.26]|uniref:Uncharacterized protein n=1 Tax=Zopfia rhizophila CBS 207.26 TaxID=1314779 RepID=A0A6A6EHK8_9PEZI|nr:hypothetical protein K469DRAFT_807857 [Zopfia rhizophila CBS 207.26]